MTLHLKIFFTCFILAAPAFAAAQQDSLPSTPSNSCQQWIESHNMVLKYIYSDSAQIHDYSGNWDFDGDGEKDGLFFVGTGGAHLYYYLRVALSSNGSIHNFTFLELDMPCPAVMDKPGREHAALPERLPHFMVRKFPGKASGNNTTDKICMLLHEQAAIPAEWRKRGLTSKHILVSFKNGRPALSNYKNVKPNKNITP
jgi:hypothetical protein